MCIRDSHGDGVRDIALRVEDAERAYVEAMRRGARSIQEPLTVHDEQGRITKATIATYGDTCLLYTSLLILS